MYASDSKWEYAVLEDQGTIIDPQQGDFDPQTPAVNSFSVADPSYRFDGQPRSIPRNMEFLQGLEFFKMNAPFLTESEGHVLPSFAQSINANATADIATPPTSVIAPSLIHSIPQELPPRPDLASQGSLSQSCHPLQQQQQQPGSPGHPINYSPICLGEGYLLPLGPDCSYYYVIFGHSQQQQVPQLPFWIHNAAVPLPSQTATSFAHVGSYNLSLSSSGASIPQGFVIPDSPESFTLASQQDMKQEMELEVQQQDENQPQAAQRKKLPDIPARAQTPDDASEESSTTTEEDNSSASDVSENDFNPYLKTSQRKNNNARKRDERSLGTLESPVEPQAADRLMPDARGIDNDRKARDRFIVACRSRGMTYREIKKAGNMHEAESTLRGRHRVLTKCKAQRIRKPQWTKRDIELLRTAVLSRTWRKKKGKKMHIIWSEVAADMIESGSSYHFGALTCSNKWSEITGNSFRE